MSADLLQHFQNNQLSHAYCVIGDIRANEQMLATHFKEAFDEYLVQRFDFGRMKIADAQALRSFGIEQGKKIILVQISFAQHEAQNALLKFIEEPARDTHVVLCIPGSDTLIPTILSRCEVVDMRGGEEGGEVQVFPIHPEKFLAMSPQERLDKIKATTKDDDSWAYADVLEFIRTLEKLLHTKMKSDNNKTKYLQVFETIGTVKEYLRSPSASIPMLLEMIALTL